MRTAIIALLAMSPMMLNAQANSPAKTQANGPVLQSKLTMPKAFAASEANAIPGDSTRISTGVTAPKLISQVDIATPTDRSIDVGSPEKTVVLSMVVNANGKPEDVKIVKSAGVSLDKNVLAAVNQFRYKPGTLNNEPIAIPLTLEVKIQNSTR